MTRGWWGMHCWNALSDAQQDRLIHHGNLAMGHQGPERQGGCPRPAEVEITTMYDVAPGPRFYCRPCGIVYLKEQATATRDLPDGRILGA